MGGNGFLRPLFQKDISEAVGEPKIAGSKLIVNNQNGGMGESHSLSSSHLNLWLFRSQNIQAFSGPYIQEVFFL